MKLPARVIAILLWVMAVALVGDQLLELQRLHQMPEVGDTFYVVLHVGNALTYLSTLIALGAIVWLLGDIRDRLAERK